MYKTASQIADEVLCKLAAELKTELLPYQQRVVGRLQDQPGLLVVHGLGTGKTLSSIGAALDQGGKTVALVPASLAPNYNKEIRKHVEGNPHIQVKSQQRAALRNERTPANLLIVDEAHKARETNTKLYHLLKHYPADKRLLLTATPVYNRPSDIAPLINIAAGEKVLPQGGDFDARYVYKPPSNPGFFYRMSGRPMKPELRHTGELKKVLKHWVDYQDNSVGEFPERIDEEIRVPMSEAQTKLHDAAWGSMPWGLRHKLEGGALPSGKDLSSFNQFESQTRQISGSTNKYLKEKEISPKLQRAVDELHEHMMSDPDYRAVVYSNYLDTLKDYSEQLDKAGIPHRMFTGDVSARERQEALDAYHKGELKALLLSSAGGEGLDLKETRLVQVLEPHWNEEKLDQVIGRAIRHQSHSGLPEDKRNVTVQRYLTYPKPGWWGRLRGKEPIGVESVLSAMSKNKRELNDQMTDLMR